MQLLLEYLNIKGDREYIFKPTIAKESLPETGNSSGIRVVNFAKYRIIRNISILILNL
jgi:hypothetical protein